MHGAHEELHPAGLRFEFGLKIIPHTPVGDNRAENSSPG